MEIHNHTSINFNNNEYRVHGNFLVTLFFNVFVPGLHIKLAHLIRKKKKRKEEKQHSTFIHHEEKNNNWLNDDSRCIMFGPTSEQLSPSKKYMPAQDVQKRVCVVLLVCEKT